VKKYFGSLGLQNSEFAITTRWCRLEISPDEMEKVLRKEIVDELARRFRELGFKYVTLDLHGFRSGSMNELLQLSTHGDRAGK
jgi:uncharacterized protein